jgi:hypothetical protein
MDDLQEICCRLAVVEGPLDDGPSTLQVRTKLRTTLGNESFPGWGVEVGVGYIRCLDVQVIECHQSKGGNADTLPGDHTCICSNLRGWVGSMTTTHIPGFALKGAHLDVKDDVTMDLLIARGSVGSCLQNLEGNHDGIHLFFESVLPEGGWLVG